MLSLCEVDSEEKIILHMKDVVSVSSAEETGTECLIDAERAQQENVCLFVPRSSFASFACIYVVHDV